MKTSKTFTVYRHITPDGKIYVGCTGQKPEDRWQNGRGYKNTLFGKAIEDFGWDNIKHEILDTNLDEFEAKCLEEYYIFSFRTFVGFSDCNGYNMTLGGDGSVGFPSPMKGKKHTEESKNKISESTKGKNLGKPHTEEHKRKISASLIGNKNNYGKHPSEETRRKRSESMKGKNLGKPSPIKGRHRVNIDGKIHYE